MKNKLILLFITLFISSCNFKSKLEINLQKGMSYDDARGILLNSGWQYIFTHQTGNGMPICYDSNPDVYLDEGTCEGYYEIISCNADDYEVRICHMLFVNSKTESKKSFLNVITNNQKVAKWWISKEYPKYN